MKKPRNKAAPNSRRSPGFTRTILAPSIATVLHVDDDPNDTELLQAAARRANVRFSVQNVTDGEQAMAYLSGRGVYANRQLYPLPVLVLLDLKMPQATGFDVLRWIRAHPEADNLPVVVFSGSELQDDVQQAFAVGADSYLVKPIGFNALIDLVRKIDTVWIGARAGKSPLIAAAVRGRNWPSNEWSNDVGGNAARP
jgi:CheY-like chemotaxis protein